MRAIVEKFETIKGLDHKVLEEVTAEGSTNFAALIFAYNTRIASNQEKIDPSNRATIQEIADFLRNKGLEKEAKKFESFLAEDKRAKVPELLDKKPGSGGKPVIRDFPSIERSLPEDDK